jgi:UDP-3-O-[3-hydroxymyristoyl] glucosamine N-acyltransferase
VTLKELAERLGCEVRGDERTEVVRLRGIEEAGPGDLTFVANPKFLCRLATTRASAVIIAPNVETQLPCLVAADPYLLFARALAILYPPSRPAPGVHASAQVDPSAVLGEGVHVGPLSVVGPRVRVGPRSVIHSHVVLYGDVEIGADCLLYSGVHVREGCRIGDRVILQDGVVVGADGFGFAKDGDGRYHKIPQIGVVVIEDDVEIQAHTTVDRAALGETRIGRGTKIDNLVQVAHSVVVGSDTILCAQVGIAGSTKIGSRVTLAGQVGVANHVTVGDGVIATAQTGIPNDVAPGKLVSGYPAVENRTWLRASVLFAKLPELVQRLRALERRLAGHDSQDS